QYKLYLKRPLHIFVNILFSIMHPPLTALYTLSLHDALPIFLDLKPKVKEFLKDTIGLYINGEYVKSTEGETFDVLNPATEEKFRSEEHTSELQSRFELVCRLLLE